MQTDKRILLILDLDETLVHATKTELDRKADFIVFNYHIYKRPFLDQFIRFCSGNFRLAIWSSASDDYVEEVVKRIIPDDIKLDFVWGEASVLIALMYPVLKRMVMLIMPIIIIISKH
ncbi:MAG: HAD family hydrolase [Sporocytophaga sp.]|nr:HAD family hydrolase [Sporocytophaga sp.]